MLLYKCSDVATDLEAVMQNIESIDNKFFVPINTIAKSTKSLNLCQKLTLAMRILQDAESMARQQNLDIKFDIIDIVDDIKSIQWQKV